MVYAINKSWLTKAFREWGNKEGGATLEAVLRLGKLRDGKAFREMFFKRGRKMVGAVSPFRLNQRLSVQKGIFLFPGDVRHSFVENLRSLNGHKENVITIPIQAAERAKLLKSLDQAGVSRASLFPDLDGFAQSLRTRMILLSHLQDLERIGARTSDNIGIETLDDR